MRQTAAQYSAARGVREAAEVSLLLHLLRRACEAKPQDDPYRMVPTQDMADAAISQVIERRGNKKETT